MKILFLSYRTPYPPFAGDKLKNYWTLKILAKKYDVHLVAIVEEKEKEPLKKWAKENNISCKVFTKTKSDFLSAVARSITNSKPLQTNYYYFKDVQDYVNNIYKDFDVIYVSTIRMAEYCRMLNKPKVLDFVDSFFIRYKNSIPNTASWIWKIIYSVEIKRLEPYEKLCIEDYDLSLFVNPIEAEYYKKTYGDKIYWLPNGANSELLKYPVVENPRNFIVFFGKMDYQPNIDAVLWFVENVFPKVDKNIKFYIIGTKPTKYIKSLPKKDPRIVVTGFLENPYEVINKALCVVAPMQTGSGIQNKVLEAMALGTVNIISSLTAKPLIGAENFKHLIIEDNPGKFSEIINDIYKTPEKFNDIKYNAKEFIKNNFTWEIYGEKLIKIIESLV